MNLAQDIFPSLITANNISKIKKQRSFQRLHQIRKLIGHLFHNQVKLSPFISQRNDMETWYWMKSTKLCFSFEFVLFKLTAKMKFATT